MRIYLACPYSHPDPIVRETRFQTANRIAGELIKAGYIVYSPISHSHPIAEACPELGHDWEAWRRIDKEFIRWSEAVYVARLLGWEKSLGIKREIQFAIMLERPILYSDDSDGTFRLRKEVKP